MHIWIWTAHTSSVQKPNVIVKSTNIESKLLVAKRGEGRKRWEGSANGCKDYF